MSRDEDGWEESRYCVEIWNTLDPGNVRTFFQTARSELEALHNIGFFEIVGINPLETEEGGSILLSIEQFRIRVSRDENRDRAEERGA